MFLEQSHTLSSTGERQKKSPLADKKNLDFFSPFFTHIYQSNQNALKLTIFIKNGQWLTSPTRNVYSNYDIYSIHPFIPMVVLTTNKYRKIFFTFCLQKKYIFFTGGGSTPPPLIAHPKQGGGVKLCIIFSFLIISIIYEAIMMQFEA